MFFWNSSSFIGMEVRHYSLSCQWSLKNILDLAWMVSFSDDLEALAEYGGEVDYGESEKDYHDSCRRGFHGGSDDRH